MSRRFILSRADLKLKTFSRAVRSITLDCAGSDGVLSHAGSGGFFSSRAGLQLPSFGRAGLQLPSFGRAGLELPI